MRTLDVSRHFANLFNSITLSHCRIIYFHHFPPEISLDWSRFIYINLNSTEFIFLLEPLLGKSESEVELQCILINISTTTSPDNIHQ